MKRTIFILFSLVPLAFGACGGGSDSGDCTATNGPNKAQFVVNAVMVPSTSGKDFGADLNGDGKIDNQLGQIILTLADEGLMGQDGVNMALTNGDLILLMDESSTDSTFQSDSCASTTLQLGQSMASPDFSGS